jgi:crossover junction endodeoxyribonuclease RuvC
VIICGIDPGLSGALALFASGNGSLQHVSDMPVLELHGSTARKQREVDVDALREYLAAACPDHAFLEKSWSRPEDGAASGFRFGDAYGSVRGVLGALKIPRTVVSPQRWKKALDVQKGKDAARARASQLMPAGAPYWRLKTQDGRAEAALIAYFGWVTLRQ